MPLKVLIIDDHADWRRLLVHHVSTRWPDAQVREFDPLLSGRLPEGFAGAGNDIVLVGDPCGGESALEWLRQFRLRPKFPPVIIIGSGEEAQVVEAVKMGAAEYVGKPRLGHARLVQAIETALREGAGRSLPPAVAAGGGIPAVLGQRGYEVLRRLADGDLATVWLVRRQGTPQPFVLKVLRAMPETHGEMVLDRFLLEYELIARLDHPNVVRIHDFGVADDHAYIAMEYCGGGSLKRRITAGLAPAEACRLLREIAAALGALHAASICHRDLKPTNVLFREDGTLVLIDFGLAKRAALQAGMTGSGAIFGTPYYMSPEQGHGESVDARGDIYSLGVIFHEMLTGRKPFDGDTAMTVIVKHRQAPLPRLPSSLVAYQPLLDRMLAKHPDERFQSIDELLSWPLPD